MNYTTSIAHGCTIIKFEFERKSEHAIISHCGGGKYYRVEYVTKGKRHFIGQRKELDDARALKGLADEHLQDDTFWEWYDQLKKRG